MDPRHSKVTFLTEEQRKLTYPEIIDQAELLKLGNCSVAEPPPPKRKSSAVDFSWEIQELVATLSRYNVHGSVYPRTISWIMTPDPLEW